MDIKKALAILIGGSAVGFGIYYLVSDVINADPGTEPYPDPEPEPDPKPDPEPDPDPKPGSTISIMTFPIGWGRVVLNPDKNVYENEYVTLTAYPIPPVMDSTETFEFDYWIIFVDGEIPERSHSNPLNVYMGNADIYVQAHLRELIGNKEK